MRKLLLCAALILFCGFASLVPAYASPEGTGQPQPANTPGTTSSRSTANESQIPLPRVGIGVKVSTLGVGVEVATPLTNRLNVRAGFNAFQYSDTFSKDGVNYGGQLNFQSAETHLDWFPFGGGFHLSPGMLIYNGNQIKASASVGGGQTFTLSGTTYASAANNPITGNGKLEFNKTAPTFLLGWGSLLPRTRHFSVPFEVGFAYQGDPKVTLSLNGGACDPTGLNCRAINSDPTIQSNIQSEQQKLNKSASPIRFYPILSTGFAYRF